MIKKFTLSLFVFLGTIGFSLAQVNQGTIKGKVLDVESGQPVPFATVVVTQNGSQVTGASSDFNGNYTIGALTPGKYDVMASFVGYQSQKVTGVLVTADQITFQNFKLGKGVALKKVIVVGYKIPLISKDQVVDKSTMTGENIAHMGTRNISDMAATVGGVSKKDNGSNSLNIRGSRSANTAVYVDGMKVIGSQSLPKDAIAQLTVITGGIPAKYGDVTGGIVSITTKEASKNYSGGLEYTTSGFKIGDNVYGLDNYGYNILGFNLSGPLISLKDSTGKKKDANGNRVKPILDFFVSGELRDILDGTPSAGGNWMTKPDVLTSIEKNPLIQNPIGTGAIPNASFLRTNDFQKIAYRRNAQSKQINIAGKIGVHTNNNSTLTFGGSYFYDNERLYSYAFSLFDNEHDPQDINSTWRVFGRYTKRFNSKQPDKNDSSAALIQNASISLQVDYSQNTSLVQDPLHKDNLAQYGYVGKFTSQYKDVYTQGSDGSGNTYYELANFQQTAYKFQYDSSVNPMLSNYTQQYYNLYGDSIIGHYENAIQVQQGGGLLNGQSPQSIYDMWNAPGTVYNLYQRTDDNQFGINASGSADIKKNSISFGLVYQQNTDRAFGVNPAGLWTLGRNLVNRHLTQLDQSDTIFAMNGYYPVYTFHRLYDGASQEYFDKSIRKKLGLKVDGTDFIDFDSYGPDLWTLSDFSADELLNQGASYVDYYGYDYKGDKIKGRPTLKDYFTDKDENGNFTRLVPAFQPIYSAVYLQDKFAFNDLIFNVGLRVDRYDANQPVLKDPYSLFATMKAGDLDIPNRPSNIGDDYVVYVGDLNNPSVENITGYRNGDDWYDAKGTLLSSPTTIESPTGIAPWLVDPSKHNTITDLDASAFKDYKPQITAMPRISFSFPISDEALFFAHYDILTQRPTAGDRFSPIEYQYMQSFTSPIHGNTSNLKDNPDLKPQKTIDYELGFEQKLNSHSALKIQAFYKELRDMIQVKKFEDAYPYTYVSYDNLDFGTVKGTTISYDFRRTGNVSMRVSYTLQFAAGTGSSSTTSFNLVNSGYPNLRTIAPFSYDQRHSFVGVIDYRYANGQAYNGPVVNGKDIFANAGANITFRANSGTPYTKKSLIIPEQLFTSASTQTEGSLNGSRLPWTFGMDLKIDKAFQVTWKKDKSKDDKVDNSKKADVDVYLQVLNLLNNKNILSVYPATGIATDDGYLNEARYQTFIDQQYDPQSYRDMYNIKLQDPSFYSLPRRIRLGVQVSF